MRRARHVGHDVVRVVFVGLVIGAVLAVPARAADPLPEFFGTYAIDGGRLIQLNSQDDVDLGPQTKFVYFGQRISEVSDGPYMRRLLFIRYVDEPTEETFWESPPTHIVKRVNEMIGSTARTVLLVKPVPGKPQMVILVPSEPLAPGAYSMGLGRVDVRASIYVNKSTYLKNRESDGFCFDNELAGGFDGVDQRARGFGSPVGRLIPCRQSTLKEGTYCGPGAQDEGPCSTADREADVTMSDDAEPAGRSAAASTQSEDKPSQTPEASPGYKNCVSLGSPPQSCAILYGLPEADSNTASGRQQAEDANTTGSAKNAATQSEADLAAQLTALMQRPSGASSERETTYAPKKLGVSFAYPAEWELEKGTAPVLATIERVRQDIPVAECCRITVTRASDRSGATLENEVAATIEYTRQALGNSVIAGPVSTQMAGADARVFFVTGTEGGVLRQKAVTVAVGGSVIYGLVLHATPATFETVWDTYRRVRDSYKAEE